MCTCMCISYLVVHVCITLQDASDGDEFVPLKPISESSERKSEGGADSAEQGDGERLKDMFEARLVIHEALHLPMMTDKTQ